MLSFKTKQWRALRLIAEQFSAFLDCRSGASALIFALASPVLIGTMGLATEISYWHMHQRSMQNASDAAAIAAALNGGTSAVAEAKAVAALYGYVDGSGGVKVNVNNTNSAAGCTSNCYTVTISDAVPLMLSQVVGYKGTTTLNGKAATAVVASSVSTGGTSTSYCILALAGSGVEGIRSNGAPKADLQGCSTMSNTTSTCNGHNLNATFGDAAGINNGCGVTQRSNVMAVADPYSGSGATINNYAANLTKLSDPCKGAYAQEPSKKKDPALPAANQLSSSPLILSGTKTICGDLQLTADVTINGSNDAILYILNGRLDLNGYKLTGKSVTIVFSGSNNASYQHIVTGGGTLDITPPSDASALWKGVAIYQDPSLTTNVDVTYAGNSPTWNVSGLVYMPHASVTMSGAVNKSATGATCFVMVVDNITINGTGSIFANNTQCASAGLTPPRGGSRPNLVN